MQSDGTKDKSKLGANAILAVSIASARAAAIALDIPLYRFLGGVSGNRLPVPMMNILNGGAHAANTVDVQEFMIMPVGRGRALRRACAGAQRCSMHWQSLLKSKGLATSVGDEGGFAPDLASDEEAIEYILEAVRQAGYEPGKDFVLAMDAASSEWKGSTERRVCASRNAERNSLPQELVSSTGRSSVDKYPIYLHRGRAWMRRTGKAGRS